MDYKKITGYFPWILLIVLCSIGYNGLFRQLWFDEALTIIEFVNLKNISDIYWHYTIPNNHILFTIVERIWSELCIKMSGGMPDFYYRLVPFGFAFGSIAIIYFCWKKRIGTVPALVAALCLMLTQPFTIYAVAVRGYMMGIFFILLGFEFGFRLRNKKWIYALWYFLAALAAVGTVPSNLLAFAAITLYLVPKKLSKVFRPEIILLAVLPVAAFFCFYLPIWSRFMGNVRLGEGWHDKWHAVGVVYLVFILSMLPLLPFSASGSYLIHKRFKFGITTIAQILTFLIPLSLVLLKVYPFPRVLLCLWPIWIYTLAALSIPCFRLIRNKNKRPDKKMGRVILISGLMLVICSILKNSAASQVSTTFIDNTGGNGDNLIYPYYIHNYDPAGTVGMLKDSQGPIFLSFNADRYPLIFYAFMQGIDYRRFIFDLPNGKKVDKLQNGTIIILGKCDNPQGVAERFHLKQLIPVKENGYHRIFQAVCTKGN